MPRMRSRHRSSTWCAVMTGLMVFWPVVGCNNPAPPLSKYCDDKHPCPNDMFCHVSDGLCHATPADGGADTTPPTSGLMMFDAGPQPARTDSGVPIIPATTLQCDSQNDCSQPCAPGATRCVDSRRLDRCGDDGTWKAADSCDQGCLPGGTHCLACKPGATRCDAGQPQVCRDDGGAWVDNGARCAMACVDGACPACMPGQATRCHGSVVEACTAPNKWSAQTTCTGSCVRGECRVCAPGSSRCNGTTWELCAADGGGWGQASVRRDVCGAQCDPGSTRCLGPTFSQCGDDGRWSAWAPTIGQCGVICLPGQQSCAGTTPRHCDDDGTSYVDDPVHAGMCDADCEPGTIDCRGTESRACSAFGVWSNYAVVAERCGAVCDPSELRCQGAQAQACQHDGSGWSDQDGACDCASPARDDLGYACGNCGGTIQCDGSCSIPTPDNLGDACGDCGGKVLCDGTCSIPLPDNYDHTCGSCGDKIQCDGSCRSMTPANFGKSCGGCGGKVACDGTCSVRTPDNLGVSCGSCGGVILCDGSCSISTPRDVSQACGKCGGVRQCDGTCSSAMPSPACNGKCCTPDECGGCKRCVAADASCQ